jgi:alpha-1,6-mannosyltransferase
VACADAVQRLLRRDPPERRRLARQQAEQFGWPAAVNGFLGAHGLTPLPRGGEGAPAVRVGT